MVKIRLPEWWVAFNQLLSDVDRKHLENIIVSYAFDVPCLSKTKLIKLIYLADLYFFKRHRTKMTNINYVHYNYGPYSPIIETIAEEMEGEKIRFVEGVTKEGHEFISIKPNVEEATVTLPKAFFPAIEDVVKEWGERSLEEILAFIKKNPPFVNTPFKGVIDFERSSYVLDDRFDFLHEYAIRRDLVTTGVSFTAESLEQISYLVDEFEQTKHIREPANLLEVDEE